MDRAYKPQISPRHGLDPVLDHVMGFLQPTLGPLGYLVVKQRSKCGQLWTLGIRGGGGGGGGVVPGTEGVQKGVGSERKGKRNRRKNVER